MLDSLACAHFVVNETLRYALPDYFENHTFGVLAKMLWKTFFTVLSTVFLAEIGDKTQLATMLFSANANTNKWAVFFGSATALVLAAGIGVLIGAQLEKFISPQTLKWFAGIGFIVVGLWTLLSK